MKNKINIAIVDDHDLVRVSFSALLAAETNFNILFEAGDSTSLYNNLEIQIPDILLLDITLPGISGIDIAKDISVIYPEIKIILLSSLSEEEIVNQAIEAGVMGYITKNANIEELKEAVNIVYRGEKYFSKVISKTIIDSYLRNRTKITNNKDSDISGRYNDKLTEREKEILKLTAEGIGNTEIGKKLFISPRTVETHKARLMKKLNLSSIADLIKYAIKNNIIDI
jgi:DNA-binding NarL/FixJ family response regulator